MSQSVHLSFDGITQHLVCVLMPLTQNVWGRILHLWTCLDALSAVEIVVFISWQCRPALFSFIFSVFKDVYTLLGDNGCMYITGCLINNLMDYLMYLLDENTYLGISVKM